MTIEYRRSIKMSVNVNDEYYTPCDLAEYCVTTTKSVLNLEDTNTYLEPSAGGGVFMKYLPKMSVGIDINPQHKSVTFGDFLEDSFEYRSGLCVIGNPPFGYRNTLAVKFFKKAITVGDFISFILPISQLDNQQQMYEFDLIHSEDLGKKVYSGVEVHCCLNIYKRPTSGVFNSKPSYKVQGLRVAEYRRGSTDMSKFDMGFDIGICSWGNSVGCVTEVVGTYAQEHYIYIESKEHKAVILDFITKFNWKGSRNYTSTPKLQTWYILKTIKTFLEEK
jgi:predicted RNA methylase